MGVDIYGGRTVSITGPAVGAVAVTPDDEGDFNTTRGVYVGVSGDLHVLMEDETEVTFVGLAAGVIHPMRITRVYEDSTATSILAVY